MQKKFGCTKNRFEKREKRQKPDDKPPNKLQTDRKKTTKNDKNGARENFHARAAFNITAISFAKLFT